MRFRALAAMAAAAVLLLTAACQGDHDDPSVPAKIVVGYQQLPSGDLIVKHDKWLEAAFGPSTKIEWKVYGSDDAVNQAMQAGSIDFGLVDSSSAARALSSGVKYQVPWIFGVIGNAEALVAKSGVANIKSLKGKTIATPAGSTSHYSLLAALKNNGLDATSVKITSAEPSAILTAWQRGTIAAAYVGGSVLPQLTASGGKTLLTSAKLAENAQATYDLGVVTDAFAKKYPKAVQTWVEQEDKAVKLIKADPTSADAAVAAELHVPATVAKAQLNGLILLTADQQAGDAYLGRQLSTDLLATAQFNKTIGKISTVLTQPAYKAAVDKQYALAVPGR